jgi:histidinol phosphatase-like enzyme
MLVVPSSYQSMFEDQGSSSVQQRAVFLDRDGVIKVNNGYVQHPGNFKCIDGIFKVALAAHATGF